MNERQHILGIIKGRLKEIGDTNAWGTTCNTKCHAIAEKLLLEELSKSIQS